MSNPRAATSVATTIALHLGVRRLSSELIRDFCRGIKDYELELEARSRRFFIRQNIYMLTRRLFTKPTGKRDIWSHKFAWLGFVPDASREFSSSSQSFIQKQTSTHLVQLTCAICAWSILTGRPKSFSVSPTLLTAAIELQKTMHGPLAPCWVVTK